MFMILLVGSFSAQTAISLEEARQLALEQNPGYQASKAALEAAKWQKTGAFSAFLPSLSLGGTLLYMDPARSAPVGGQNIEMNKDQRSLSLNLSQPLFMGGKLYQAYKMASISREMAEANLKAERISLLAGVEERYYALLQLKQLKEIAGAEYEQARSNLEIAELKMQNGIIARSELLRFQANLATKDLARLQSGSAYDIAMREFASFLGTSELYSPILIETQESEIALFADLDTGAMEAFTTRLRDYGRENNVQLQVIEGGKDLAQRAYKASKGSFLPTVNLVGSRSYDENGLDRYEFEASNQIMLNLSVPLLPQVGNYSAMKKAGYEAEKAEHEAKEAADGILLGMDAALIKLVSSARSVKTARLSLDITEDMYNQLSERFRLNMISPMDLIDAELMLSAARMAYTNSYHDFYEARLALMSMLGTEDIEVLHTILGE
jgi:outer membrane protein TolC